MDEFITNEAALEYLKSHNAPESLIDAVVEAKKSKEQLLVFAISQNETITKFIDSIKPTIIDCYSGTSYEKRFNVAMNQALLSSRLLLEAFTVLSEATDLATASRAIGERAVNNMFGEFDKGYEDDEKS